MLRKVIFGLGVVSAFVLLLSAAALGLGQIQSRQQVYTYLDEALVAPRERHVAVNWQPPDQPLARDFTSFDEIKIAKAVSEAWAAHAAAQETGVTSFLPDYFSGVALQRAGQAARTSHAGKTRMAILSLTGAPVFYHLDGSVLQARFKGLTVRFSEAGDRLAAFHATLDHTTSILMNETTGWRLYAHERHASEKIEITPASLPATRLAGINYYPSLTPWRAFWAGFDLSIIEADFDRIGTLGGNSIRIFMPRDAFLDRDIARRLADLEALLDAAWARGLSVVPTLFDLKYGYDLASWPEDVGYLRNVLPVLSAHPAVSFIDLKNEPDLDFETQGRARIEAWIRAMVLVHRQLAPDLPLTVGWSAAEHAHVAADALDLITYHDYAPLDGAARRLEAVRYEAGGKPVMITEIGESSYSLVPKWPSSPRQQADRLAARMAALSDADGLFVWTLHDFPDPDPTAVGHSPWIRNLQSRFGLFDESGTAKPAASAVSAAFSRFMKGRGG